MRDIRGISEEMDVSNFGQMFRKTTYADSYGREQPVYEMNRDGFMFVVMGFTGKKATAVKLHFIKAFNAMEQKLIQLLAERKSAEWLAERENTKRGNLKMCAAIHDNLLPLARAQGSTASDKVFYITYQKAVNKAAGIKSKSRDSQPLGQLYEIEKMQDMVTISIKGLTAGGKHYKQIYRDTNQTPENYSRISFIPERFLPN